MIKTIPIESIFIFQHTVVLFDTNDKFLQLLIHKNSYNYNNIQYYPELNQINIKQPKQLFVIRCNSGNELKKNTIIYNLVLRSLEYRSSIILQSSKVLTDIDPLLKAYIYEYIIGKMIDTTFLQEIYDTLPIWFREIYHINHIITSFENYEFILHLWKFKMS